MKSLTEAQLKDLLRKAWEHGYSMGFGDGPMCPGSCAANELKDAMVKTICNGKLIELVGEA